MPPSNLDGEPMTGTGLPAMHPGELLREEILPALGRPRVEIARLLGVSRQALHAVLAERASVTPEMALRLGKLCGSAKAPTATAINPGFRSGVQYTVEPQSGQK